MVYKHGQIKPAVVQIKSHPYLPQWEFLEYCRRTGVVFFAFASLRHGISPRLLDDPVITGIADRLKKSAARRFGSEVTVIEKGSRLIRHEDDDVSAAVKDILEAEGMRIRLDAECLGFAQRGSDIAISVDCESRTQEIVGSHILLAVGRRPNTDDLGLDATGVETDKHGYITVDDELRTTVPNIWALGDCNGEGAFTHTAYNDYEIVAANLLEEDCRRVSDRLPAYALYVDPPLGRAGLTETEARRSGKRLLV